MGTTRPLAGMFGILLLALAVPGCAGDGGTSRQSAIFSFNRGAQGPFEKFSNKLAGLGGATAAEVSAPVAGPNSKGPKDPYALARLCERRGQPAQAETLYKSAIERFPNKVGPYHRLGIMRARQGRFEEANQYFAKALAIAPADSVLLGDAGYCYYLQRNMDQAEPLLRRAVEADPREPRNCNNLATLLAEKGAYDESLALFRRVGSDSQAHANLAFVHARQGRVDEAKANYHHALTLDPKMRPAAEALAQLSKYDNAPQAVVSPGRPVHHNAVAASSYEAPSSLARQPGRQPPQAERAVLVTTIPEDPPIAPPAGQDPDIPMPKIGFSDRDAEAVIAEIAGGKVSETAEGRGARR